jgi:hypothetical protein
MTNPKKPSRMAREATLPSSDSVPAAANTSETVKRPTKQELVLSLLRSDGGTTLGLISEATNWLPHTARAALTGLRKKGHAIEKAKVDGETRYSIAALVAA